MPPRLPFTADHIAKLAGLEWNELIRVQFCTGPGLPKQNVDPFFDALAALNIKRRTITLYERRCHEAALRLGSSFDLVCAAVVTHMTAHIVVVAGKHPQTGKRYIQPYNPIERFVNEQVQVKPTHPGYNKLSRQQELFAQIFSYLWTFWNAEPEEIALFHRISQGH